MTSVRLCVCLSPVLVRRGGDDTAELVLLDHGLYQFLSHG